MENEININQFKFEKHVEQAFLTAIEIAGAQAISAADLIRAIHVVNQKGTQSAAFSTLVSLLPQIEVPSVLLKKRSPKWDLSQGLAKSFLVAKNFFQTSKTIWGRDFVTLALLADQDPTLYEIANESETAVDVLQDEWFKFVTSMNKHRNPEEWEKWWQEAGITLPSMSTPPAKSSYLFTWNPELYDETNLKKYIEELEKSGATMMSWSTGARRKVAKGDKVYLLRQGVEPRGIIGAGEIAGDLKEVPHFNEKRRKDGKKVWIADVLWNKLDVIPIIERNTLIAQTENKSLWNTQAGGVKIDPEIVTKIDGLINEPVVGDMLSFAKTLSDLDHRNDWIGIRRDIEALSTLLAVNRIEPPLSIAILGEWGSGKTFLMKKIQERVQILEDVGKEQEKNLSENPDVPRYYGSILQIEFNSWHYTESNLWASIVNHIFEKLNDKINPQEKNKKNVEKFFEKFRTAQLAREAAQQKIDLVSAEVKLAEKEVETIEKQVKSAKGRLSAAIGKNIWEHLDIILKEDGNNVKELKDALKFFGFTKNISSAQTIYKTIDRFRSVSGRAKELFGSLLATPTGIVGGILLAILVVGATYYSVINKVPIVSIGTTLAGILTWLAERAGRSRKWLSAIQVFDDWFMDAKQKEESRLIKLKASAQADLDHRKEALLNAKHQLNEVQLREARAKEDLKNLTVREQIRRFVDERVTAQTYAKHLGLVSSIRKDFEYLSDSMEEKRKEKEKKLVQRVTKTIKEDIPTVDRIILYIDDLDRCKPERVVEVLEAIHLLLAFRLFIVVVAVDPRWVLESLRRRYPHLSENRYSKLRKEISDIRMKNHNEATAHDYLEKIFNVPFWVKPMSPKANENLIAGYLSFAKSEQDDASKSMIEEEKFHDLLPANISQQATFTERKLIVDQKEIQEKIKSKKTQPDDQSTIDKEEEVIKRQEQERKTAAGKIKDVSISADEEDFIRKLAPSLGDSPRRIKRYANTYMLLKSSLSPEESQKFTKQLNSCNDCKIVLVFLAIITGAPTLAPQIFSNAFRIRNNFTIKEVLNGINTNSLEYQNARQALEMLKNLNILKDEIEIWIPRIMRFAFRLTPVYGK